MRLSFPEYLVNDALRVLHALPAKAEPGEAQAETGKLAGVASELSTWRWAERGQDHMDGRV
jgi:hypothetical protein